MTLLQKILKNKSWLVIAAMLILLIIFYASGFIFTNTGTGIMVLLLVAAAIFAFIQWNKRK